jgi:hypothetical protein
MVKKVIQRLLRRGLPFMGNEWNRGTLMQSLLRLEYAQLCGAIRASMPDNPCLHGYKAYSQFDEDGIIAEITRALGLKTGTFIEFGCGNGLENNTHLLLLKGWRGGWVDGDAANMRFIREQLPATPRLCVDDAFVTLDNVVSIIDETLRHVQRDELDLLSMDLDGNDAYLLARILETHSPKLIVAKYNSKIPFGVRLTVPYRPNGQRTGDDFFGASLSELIARMPGYTLVTCGLSGVNAYFVRNDLCHLLPVHTPERLFQPARVHLTHMAVGSRPSLSFLATVLREAA